MNQFIFRIILICIYIINVYAISGPDDLDLRISLQRAGITYEDIDGSKYEVDYVYDTNEVGLRMHQKWAEYFSYSLVGYNYTME